MSLDSRCEVIPGNAPIVATMERLGWAYGLDAYGDESFRRECGDVRETIRLSVARQPIRWSSEVVVETTDKHDGEGSTDDYGVTLREVAELLAAPSEYFLLRCILDNRGDK